MMPRPRSPGTGRIRVLIADDSPTTRAMLAALFGAASDFEVAGEASNGAEAIERAIALSPDLIVMDVHMPIIDGLDATKEIMREAPTPIIMVTASSASTDPDV
jgi:two-component system chemotaxis response regulator CheB